MMKDKMIKKLKESLPAGFLLVENENQKKYCFDSVIEYKTYYSERDKTNIHTLSAVVLSEKSHNIISLELLENKGVVNISFDNQDLELNKENLLLFFLQNSLDLNKKLYEEREVSFAVVRNCNDEKFKKLFFIFHDGYSSLTFAAMEYNVSSCGICKSFTRKTGMCSKYNDEIIKLRAKNNTFIECDGFQLRTYQATTPAVASTPPEL